MIKRVTPRLCIRCKGRNTSAIISSCEYWGRYIQVSPEEDATFECTYGQRNQYTIDEWIVQLRESVWRYVKSEDPITIKIYDWGYTVNYPSLLLRSEEGASYEFKYAAPLRSQPIYEKIAC